VTVGVLDLAKALRELQGDFDLDVISATKRTPQGLITIRFTGIDSPIGELENDQGLTVAINVP
jgi:hypothetical protein